MPTNNRLATEKRRLETKLKVLYRKYTEDMVHTAIQLFKVAKKLNPGYSPAHMAKDCNIPLGTIYRLLSWEKATPQVKKAVKEGKISLSVGTMLTQNTPEEQQDEITEQIIKKGLGTSEAYHHIRNSKKERPGNTSATPTRLWVQMKEDIEQATNTLKEFQKIPVSRREELLEMVKELKEQTCRIIHEYGR